MSGLARFARDGGGTSTPDRLRAGDPLAAVDAPLRRFLGARPRPAPGESCELCSAPMGEDHRHVVDLDERAILCTCRPCGLLFTGDADTHEHFRAVPDRYLRVEPFALTPVQWATLDIPVGVAFVVGNSRLEQTVAFYPSPGGATESELPLAAWGEVVAANPGLAEVEPDVEAVLLRDAGGAERSEAYVVPVDRCYELVGTLRLHWHGFDGGQEVRAAIDAFFADVEGRARPAPGRTA